MARFMVERTFPDGLEIPLTDQGAQACMSVVGTNAELGVTWVHSYVTEDHKKTFCIYDAPTPDAIRNNLGMSTEEFDKQFLAWLEPQTEKTVKNYDEWRKRVRTVDLEDGTPDDGHDHLS